MGSNKYVSPLVCFSRTDNDLADTSPFKELATSSSSSTSHSPYSKSYLGTNNIGKNSFPRKHIPAANISLDNTSINPDYNFDNLPSPYSSGLPSTGTNFSPNQNTWNNRYESEREINYTPYTHRNSRAFGSRNSPYQSLPNYQRTKNYTEYSAMTRPSGNSTSNDNRRIGYYKPSMVEDPWKEFSDDEDISTTAEVSNKEQSYPQKEFFDKAEKAEEAQRT